MYECVCDVVYIYIYIYIYIYVGMEWDGRIGLDRIRHDGGGVVVEMVVG